MIFYHRKQKFKKFLNIMEHLYSSSKFFYFIRIVINLFRISFQINSMESEEPKQAANNTPPSMLERYQATMVLAAVGDAIGYRGGAWQFTYDGCLIHKQMMEMTNQKGIRSLYVEKDGFPYSDDTVMHIATAKGLIQSELGESLDSICTKIAKHYKSCMKEMSGRAPGATCIQSASKLKHDGSNWKNITYQKNGGGCGASMRAACIGLYYYNDPQKLIQVSIESGRTTHHNPLGYLGALVAALFTAFAIKGIHPHEWLKLLMKDYLPLAKQYVGNNRQAESNLGGGDWSFFEQCWNKFAFKRQILEQQSQEAVFPEIYGVEQRQEQYKQFSVNGWAGALGVDSVIVAYDALLSTLDYEKRQKQKGIQVNKWEEVCLRGMLHGGDSDSTGTIVGAWYGAIYGYHEVYQENYKYSERKEFIQELGTKIFEKVYLQANTSKETQIISKQ